MEVSAVRVHVDVYMATPALRSLTHETLCDTGHRTADNGQRTADTLKFTNHHLPITKSLHFKPSILVFFVASPQKNIDGKNHKIWYRSVRRVQTARTLFTCFWANIKEYPDLRYRSPPLVLHKSYRNNLSIWALRAHMARCRKNLGFKWQIDGNITKWTSYFMKEVK